MTETSNNNNNTLSPFEQCLTCYIDITKLLALPNANSIFTEGFIECMKHFTTIPSSIFAGDYFLDDIDNGILHHKTKSTTFLSFIFTTIESSQHDTLTSIITSIETQLTNLLSSHSISIEESYITFLMLLYIYLQENLYGPSFTFIKETEKTDYVSSINKYNNNYFNRLLANTTKYEAILNEINAQLSVYGEEPYKHSKFIILYYIVFYFLYKADAFQTHVNAQYNHIHMLWKIRILFILNKLIDEPVDYLQKEILALYTKLDIENTFNYDNDIKGYLQIEKSFIHIKYFNYKECIAMIDKAKESLKLDISLTGKMGRKTKFQEFDTPVLVVSVKNKETNVSNNNDNSNTKPAAMTLANDNPLLERPKLSNENEEKEFASQIITIKDQMYINTLLNYIKRGLPDEDINREIILSYAEKALKESFDWLVYSKLLLHRSLAEDKSTKKIERALLQVEALCNQYNDREPLPYERLKYLFIVDYPMIFNLKKQYAQMFMSFGAVITAYEIFKDLKMWEETIKCLYVANRRDDAKKLANEVLEKHAEPGIYCILGELDNKPELFHKALEISNNRYARAYRCLGRYYMVNKDDEKAIEYYERSMALNPVYPDIWFNLGCLYLKKRVFMKALACFSKMLSLDDSNSEVWGNLGVCFIQVNKYREAMKCFEEGYNKSRKNWKLLDNLIYVSIENKEINKVIFALEQFYFIEQGDKIKPAYFYYLTKIYMEMYDKLTEHDKEFLKGKIYKLFEQFGNVDGTKPEVWDVYANFVVGVEIGKGKDVNKEKVFNNVVELRFKELRCLMLHDWEKDKKMRGIVKGVIDAVRTVLKEIKGNDVYVNDKNMYLNSIEAKIVTEENKEQSK